MDIKEIADNVLILAGKGYLSDYGDTDYFIDAEEEDVDKAYELLKELQLDGERAFKKKYGL